MSNDNIVRIDRMVQQHYAPQPACDHTYGEYLGEGGWKCQRCKELLHEVRRLSTT